MSYIATFTYLFVLQRQESISLASLLVLKPSGIFSITAAILLPQLQNGNF